MGLAAQPKWVADSVKKDYICLDFSKGNSLLAARMDAESAHSIRLVALRDFLSSLLWQTAESVQKFNLKSDYWHSKLEEERYAGQEGQAAQIEVSVYKAVLSSLNSDYRSSATALVRAYRDLSKYRESLNADDFLKFSGILGVLFREIPEQALKVLRVAGIRPSELIGFKGLEQFYNQSQKGSPERLEGYLLIVTVLKEFSEDPGASWRFAQQNGQEFSNCPLARYQGALAALKAGNSPIAARMLELKDPSAAPFPTWYYQLGRCNQLAMNPGSDTWFTRFLKLGTTDVYRHAANLRLGWNCVLRQDMTGAARYFNEIKTLAEPRTVYDKQALREVDVQGLPDEKLLRIRLIFDGGFYLDCISQCDGLLTGNSVSELSRAEILYRKSRSLQRLGRVDEAINSFKEVLQFEGKLKSYLLPNSALQIGFLYKESGQVTLARTYFKNSIELNHFEFRDGINRQAEAALRELR